MVFILKIFRLISVWLLNSEENLFLSDATLSLRENTMKPTTFFITAATAVSILLICCSEQCDLFLTGLVYLNGFYLHENLFVDAADTYGEYAICALFAAVCGIFALKQKFRILISNKLNFINAFHFSAGVQLCPTVSKYFSGGQGLIRRIFSPVTAPLPMLL